MFDKRPIRGLNVAAVGPRHETDHVQVPLELDRAVSVAGE
jgi:hypothetical protein